MSEADFLKTLKETNKQYSSMLQELKDAMQENRFYPEQEIIDRLNNATLGEWRVETGDNVEGCFVANLSELYIVSDYQNLAPKQDDALFIAHAKTDIRTLLYTIEELRKENKALKEKLGVSDE